MKKYLIILFLLAASCAKGREVSDVARFELEGLRLGMSATEVKEKIPALNIEEAKLPDGRVAGYYAFHGDLALRFSPDMTLFHIIRYHLYDEKPDPYPIFTQLTREYGFPDQTGRDMWEIHACWGKCYGKNKYMEFSLKIAGVKGGFPLNVALLDSSLDSKEWRNFNLNSLMRR